MTPADMIKSGTCTPRCLLADPVKKCRCTCGGQHHARRAQITTGLSDRSTEIVEFIARHSDGVRAAAVADHLGIEQDKVRPYLQRLERSGRILKPSTGLYTPVTDVTTVTPDEPYGAEIGSSGVTVECVDRDAVTPVTRVTGSVEQSPRLALVPDEPPPSPPDGDCENCGTPVGKPVRGYFCSEDCAEVMSA